MNINEILIQRTEKWDITDKELEIIEDNIKDVFNKSEENGIIFDNTAGITFISHLATLYKRLKEGEPIVMDLDLGDAFDDEIIELSEDITKLVETNYNMSIPKDEVILIATHLGGMREKMKEEI